MSDKVILIVCGILFVLLLITLIWWLKTGKRRFIEKRCPERLIGEPYRTNIYSTKSPKPLVIGGDGHGKEVKGLDYKHHTEEQKESETTDED